MGIPTPPIYLIIYDHAISNILKTQLKLFTIFLIELTYWHHFQNDELKKKSTFSNSLGIRIQVYTLSLLSVYLASLCSRKYPLVSSALRNLNNESSTGKKKKWQNKKNSIYQGTSMLAGATGNVYAKQQENKTK